MAGERPLKSLRQWESTVERQIREAHERGDFEALPGQGKPLSWDTWGEGDWALAHHLLRQAGETLPWISLARDIEEAETRLRQLLEQACDLPAGERARARERYLKQAAVLDTLLVEYSFIIPSRRLERGRLPPHIAARRFDAAVHR